MRVLLILATAVCAAATACSQSGPAEHAIAGSPSPAGPASAQPVPADPRIGAVFLGEGDLHTCTGSVLDSERGDLILTAAHCLAEGVDTSFVAGFDGDMDADDVWRIDTVYLDPRWVDDQDPLADFAIARVSRAAGDSVESYARGGLRLGTAPAPGATVTVTGYGLGVGGGPIGCRSATAEATRGFPSLNCLGLVPGVSGSPWTRGSVVTGVVGGLDGGGCDDDVSYSPPFDGTIKSLLARAEAGGPGDAAPTVSTSDC